MSEMEVIIGVIIVFSALFIIWRRIYVNKINALITTIETMEEESTAKYDKLFNKYTKHRLEMHRMRKELVDALDDNEKKGDEIMKLEQQKERQQSLRSTTLVNDYKNLKEEYNRVCSELGTYKRRFEFESAGSGFEFSRSTKKRK